MPSFHLRSFTIHLQRPSTKHHGAPLQPHAHHLTWRKQADSTDTACKNRPSVTILQPLKHADDKVTYQLGLEVAYRVLVQLEVPPLPVLHLREIRQT